MMAIRQRTNVFRCPPLHPTNPALHTSPSKSPFYSGKKRKIVVAHFSSVELFYLCLVVVCVRRRISTSPSSVFLVFQEKFLHSFFSALPHDLVSSGFLVMKSPHVYYCYT